MAKKENQKRFDALRYCMELFQVTEDNIFVFKDLGDRFALHTKDAKKFILPKDRIRM